MQSFRAKILTATFVLLALVVVSEKTTVRNLTRSLGSVQETARVIDDEFTNKVDTTSKTSGTDSSTSKTSGTDSSTSKTTNSATDGFGRLTNPLKSDSITAFFTSILDIILTFAIPIVVLFIMYAGFLYVTARGDEGKIKTAHAALTWAIVGGVIVLGAKLIIDVIQGTVEAL